MLRCSPGFTLVLMARDIFSPTFFPSLTFQNSYCRTKEGPTTSAIPLGSRKGRRKETRPRFQRKTCRLAAISNAVAPSCLTCLPPCHFPRSSVRVVSPLRRPSFILHRCPPRRVVYIRQDVCSRRAPSVNRSFPPVRGDTVRILSAAGYRRRQRNTTNTQNAQLSKSEPNDGEKCGRCKRGNKNLDSSFFSCTVGAIFIGLSRPFISSLTPDILGLQSSSSLVYLFKNKERKTVEMDMCTFVDCWPQENKQKPGRSWAGRGAKKR